MARPSARMATTRIIRTPVRRTVTTGQAGLAAASSLERGRGFAAAGAVATMEVTEHVASTAGEAITVAQRTVADMVAAIGAGITPGEIVVAVLIAVAAASVAEQSMAEVGFTAVADTAGAGKFA